MITILLAVVIVATGGAAHASILTPKMARKKPGPVSAKTHLVADTVEISANTYDSAAYDDDPIFCTFLVNITEKRARIFAVWGAYPLTESELLEVMYRTGTDPSGYTDGWNLYGAYFVPGGTDPLGMELIEHGKWEVESGENLTKIWKYLTDRLPSPSGAKHGYRFSRREFFARVKANMNLRDINKISVGQVIDFRKTSGRGKFLSDSGPRGNFDGTSIQ
ncbi:hypothetical protein ACFL01_05040 [Planctomycetota bacterium]